MSVWKVISPKSQHITITTQILSNIIAHLQTHLLGSQENFGTSQGAGTKEYHLLRMDPHEILVEIRFELLSSTSVPSEKDEIAFLGMFLDISNLTFGEPMKFILVSWDLRV